MEATLKFTNGQKAGKLFKPSSFSLVLCSGTLTQNGEARRLKVRCVASFPRVSLLDRANNAARPTVTIGVHTTDNTPTTTKDDSCCSSKEPTRATSRFRHGIIAFQSSHTGQSLLLIKSISMIMKTSIALLVLSAASAVSASQCVDKSTYYAIDKDVETIAAGITDEDELVHFFGGTVRLVAHDFMDFDRNDNSQGTDGCIDWDHEVNKGLWGTIWCDQGCKLSDIYYEKYTHISKADFWIAAANAVIRQLSVDQELDLIDTFLWGRKDADSCEGQGDRIPTGTGCREVQDTLLDAMGLEWRDAVALLGAHTM